MTSRVYWEKNLVKSRKKKFSNDVDRLKENLNHGSSFVDSRVFKNVWAREFQNFVSY